MMSGALLTNLRKPISRLTVTEQRLEGELRFVNSRLITNSEEIAFYKGNKREKLNIESAFDRLVNHLRKLINFKFTMGFIDNIIAKCKLQYLLYKCDIYSFYFTFSDLATCVGFTVVAYPYLVPNTKMSNLSHEDRMQVRSISVTC